MPKLYDDRTVNEMEDNISAALLADGEELYPQLQGILSANDFRSSMAKAVYVTVGTMLREGTSVDNPYLVIRKAKELGYALDEEYCRNALEMTATLTNIIPAAEAIHANAIARAEDDVGMKILSGELTASEAVKELQGIMQKTGTATRSPMDAAQEIMDFVNASIEGRENPFVATGIDSLDDVLSGGLALGGLITIAARPGTGKTTAGISIAENVAMRGTKVLYVSLEMPEKQIWFCRLANYCGVNRSEISTGKYTGDELERKNKLKSVCSAVESLSTVPFFIRDKPSTVDDIEKEVRAHDNIGLIVVDHIGLIKPSSGSGRGRYEVMTEIAHNLKQLALSLKIPILALCQLNRGSLDRKDRRPTMADLRDSGAIEEDSDVVILLFRDNDNANTDAAQRIKFIVDKNRHGMVGDVDLHFIGSMSRICM